MHPFWGQRFPSIALAFLLATLPFFHGSFAFNPYTETKWLLLNAVGCLLGISLLLSRDSSLPKPNKAYAIGCALIFISFLISIAANYPGAYREHLVDWTTFLFLLLTSFQLAKGRKDIHPYLILANALASLPVVGLCLLQYYGLSHQFGVEDRGFPFSSFGQQNLLSEYLALSICLGIYGAWQHRRWSAACYCSSALSLAALSLQYSRSATLALAIALIALLLKYRSLRLPILGTLCLGAFLILPLSFSERFPYPVPWKSEANQLQEAKSANSRIRLTRWQNTLCLIRDNPLGIGPGNYEFGYIPYQSCVKPDPESNLSMVVRSPHNGYLEIAAEGGWLALCGLLIFLAVFFCRLAFTSMAVESAPWNGIFIFISMDALFAFPMENAVPFFFAALAGGHLLALEPNESTRIPLNARKGAICFILLVSLALTSIRFYSKKVEASAEYSPQERKIACRIYPDNWRGCLRAIEALLQQGDTESAQTLAKLSVRERKNLFPAIRHLALLAAQGGDKEAACEWVRKYEYLVQPELGQLPAECR